MCNVRDLTKGVMGLRGRQGYVKRQTRKMDWLCRSRGRRTVLQTAAKSRPSECYKYLGIRLSLDEGCDVEKRHESPLPKVVQRLNSTREAQRDIGTCALSKFRNATTVTAAPAATNTTRCLGGNFTASTAGFCVVQ